MKKIIGFALFIIIIMFFIAGYNVNEVESYNHPQEDIQFNTTRYNDILQESIGRHKPTAKDIVQETEEITESDTENEEPQSPQKPMVALTFDDGPHPKHTRTILDALKKYNGLATFFILGSRAEKYKSVVREVAEAGNQIGNHTYDHKKLTTLSSQEIISELVKTSDAIFKLVHLEPKVTRPTYGSVNENVKLNAGAPLILWSIDTLDWKTRDQKLVAEKVIANVKDGDIVLMHDIYGTTAEAAVVIIEKLSSEGYQLVTVEALYAAKGIELVNGKVYANAY